MLTAAGVVSAAEPGDAHDFVHVCQDAGAGGYEAFPDVCRRADGQLICVFYAGSATVGAEPRAAAGRADLLRDQRR